MTRDLTEGKPLKLVVSFALPLLFGVLFQQFYSFVDTAVVGRFLGPDKLAAVGATGSVNFLIIGMCLGLCSGFAIPVAQAFGAKDEGEVRRCVWHSVILSAVLSAVFALAAVLLCRPLLRLMNTPEEILDSSARYIGIIFAAIPCCVLYNMAGGILRSLGDSRTPVVFLVIASLVNIALDLFLIIACGMDVAGAALATAVSQLISGIGCVIVMIRRFPILRLRREDRVFDRRLARRMLCIGLPMGLQFSITAIGSVMLQWSVNGLGVNAVAAISAAVKLSAFFACVFDALSSTMATFAGQNMGARKLDRVGQGLRSASVLGIVYCLLAFAVVALFSRSLLSLFIDPAAAPEVASMASRFLLINAAFYIPLLFVNIVRLSIQGMGFTRIAMLAGLFEMIARTAVALFVVPAAGFTGACFASPAAWVLADLFLFPCYFRVMRSLRERLMPQTDAQPAPRRKVLSLRRAA
ncbi:MAG: MATE family efflux transporter [Clostridiales bacterium]|nr:MATE family efflux transporter [Clostridiales bacterium]